MNYRKELIEDLKLFILNPGYFHDLQHFTQWLDQQEQNKPWVPEVDEEYFIIEDDGDICDSCWHNDFVDIQRLKIGNCYRTRDEAELAAKRVKKAYKN